MTLVGILRESSVYSKLVWWAADCARRFSTEKEFSWVYTTWKSGADDIKDFLWWRGV